MADTTIIATTGEWGGWYKESISFRFTQVETDEAGKMAFRLGIKVNFNGSLEEWMKRVLLKPNVYAGGTQASAIVVNGERINLMESDERGLVPVDAKSQIIGYFDVNKAFTDIPVYEGRTKRDTFTMPAADTLSLTDAYFYIEPGDGESVNVWPYLDGGKYVTTEGNIRVPRIFHLQTSGEHVQSVTATRVSILDGQSYPVQDGDTVYDGDVITIEAEAESGYRIVGNPGTITVSAEMEPVVIRAEQDTYKLLVHRDMNVTVEVRRNGSLLIPGTTPLHKGDRLTATATPQSGYTLTDTSRVENGSPKRVVPLGQEFSVAGDVNVYAYTGTAGGIHYDNGTAWETLQPMHDTGSEWEGLTAFYDTGTEWVQLG